MERHALEVIELEEPVPSYSLVTGDDVDERPVELAGEHDMNDVLRPEAALGRDRVDDHDGTLDGQFIATLDEPCLLRELTL
jgi:hypothetical protein